MTIWTAVVVKGSATKTPARTASETMRIQRLETRSIRRPAAIPMTTIGRNSAMRRALTQFESPVRSHTSTTRATNASQVPMLEASVARKSSRKPGACRKSPRRAPLRLHLTVGTVAAGSWRDTCSKGGRRALEHPLQRSREVVVLLGRSNRHTDRAGRAEGSERAHDHTLAQERFEHRLGVLPDLRVDEVGDGRRRHRQAKTGARVDQLLPAIDGHVPPPRDLRVVVEARERRVLGRLVDVESIPHLPDRLDDVRRAHAVADA